jgi:hypothetical protein
VLEEQVATRGPGNTAGHIDPAAVPKGPLGPREYAALTERARYLNAKYDPESPYDRSVNALLPWRPMNDPANRLYLIEREERDALNAAIRATVFPEPAPVEARLDAMRGNPIGTTLAVVGGYNGGDPSPAQTALFGIGAAVDAAALPHVFLPETREPAVKPMVRRPREPPARYNRRRTGAAASGSTPGAAFQTAQKRGPKPSFPTGRRVEDPGVSGVLLTKAEADFIAKNIIKCARYIRRELILVKEGEGQYRLTSGYSSGYSGQLNPPGLVKRVYKIEGSEDDWETYYPGKQFPWW